MSRYLVNADPIERIDDAARHFIKSDLPPTPCRVPLASAVAYCPPCHWKVMTIEGETVETCRKCGQERRRPQFDKEIVGKPDEALRSIIRDTHKRLALMRGPIAHKPLCAMPHPTVSVKKLTYDQVKAIRASTNTQAEEAHKYDVSPSTIRDIRAGITWRHVR